MDLSTESSGKAMEDEQKLNFYFSPFRRDRSINPHSWDSKIKFWNDCVFDHCRANKTLTFNSKTLPEKLSKRSRVPQCLDVVINDMLKKGLVQRYSDYANSCNSSWLSWSFDYFVKKPVKWSFNKFVKGTASWAYSWVSGGNDEDYNLNLFGHKYTQLPDEEYVMIDLVKQVAKDIYKRHNDSVTYDITDNVVDYNTLRQQCSDLCSDERSFEIALMELCSQKLCSLKIGPDGEKLVMMVTNKSSPMSGNELKIHKLKTTQSKMEAEISKIEKQIDECTSNAKLSLKQGKKSIALKHLKKRKQLEKILQQRDQAIDKIDNLISMIQQTESQKHVIDAFSSGVKAFKGLREQAGLTEDNIDDTMADIQEAFEAAEDINQSISRPMADLNDIDQDDLEAELDEILGISEANKGEPEEILDLPDVPSHEPQAVPRKNVLPWELN